MKATREQVLAMAREACPFTTEVWPEDEWHFTAADLEAFAHKLQQFERDQLRAQGPVGVVDRNRVGGVRWDNSKGLALHTALYCIPETLE